MMDDCVFCEIAEQESPKQVTEPWWPCVALDPIGPHAPGHKLVIPKSHITDATADPHGASIAFLSAVKYANRHVRGPVNFITSVGEAATQSVFHLHIHVIPRGSMDGLPTSWPWLPVRAVLAVEPRRRVEHRR